MFESEWHLCEILLVYSLLREKNAVSCSCEKNTRKCEYTMKACSHLCGIFLPAEYFLACVNTLDVSCSNAISFGCAISQGKC